MTASSMTDRSASQSTSPAPGDRGGERPDSAMPPAASIRRAVLGVELVADFAMDYGFAFDDFQLRACQQLADGGGVLVAAPTGSGKTVVGEFACWLALQRGRKCFYTTPVKALSNQKYHDLVARYGVEQIGLLTGDSSINAEAPVVVMTTEVLRNMIYLGSRTLAGLSHVVLDEVHCLADRFRGAVWEEVILGLAPRVRLVALSATVSNAEEFGAWLAEIRGNVEVILSEHRPVPLYQQVLVGRRLHDLFVAGPATQTERLPASARVNPELIRLAKQESRVLRDDARRTRGRRVRDRLDRRMVREPGRAGRGRPPRHDGAVETLAAAGLLPAIFFIFNRQGCDQAVRQLVGAGLRLTTPIEQNRLLAIADRWAAGLSRQDRAALGWDIFVAALGRGIAAHHAGLLPSFKAIVEEGFALGLIKVVFATETLALGINMPARTVAIEKLVKYNGETHAELTPGEYTQFTGRAGRRGIDTEGHAVVYWQPGLDPRALAGLAARRTYPLRSSFTASYNMAVNLVDRLGRVRARALLEQSFAQYQTDRRVVQAARQVGQAEELWGRAHCERGSFRAYAMLRERVNLLESELARLRRHDQRAAISAALLDLRMGDVCWIPAGEHRGWAAVVRPGNPARPEPQVLTAARQLVQLSEQDFDQTVEAVSRVRIPRRFDPHSAAGRRQLGNALQNRIASLSTRPAWPARAGSITELADQIAELHAALRAHPCHGCPERESHVRAAEQAIRLTREHDQIRTRARTQSIAAGFDRICGVLETLGYLNGDEVTPEGARLARIYNELDLVVTECIREQVLTGLPVPALAAVLSSLVYQARPTDHARPTRMPDRISEAAQSRVRAIWQRIGTVERDHRVSRSPAPDTGFAEAAYDWAAGSALATVLDRTGMPAGDFVRWIRQVIDLATQIARAPGSGALATTCQSLVAAMRRDIADFAAGRD